MDNKIVHAAPVPPFVTFVASAVPMVFDNSMSYYEALCALWKWLQDDVINVINNNASVTEEYIQMTKDMKEYMDNYFDNLDVQEEINNKLDAMVLDGTLQDIIYNYLQPNVTWTFDKVSDMVAFENFVEGCYARTLGYHSVNDGGGATYKIIAKETPLAAGNINISDDFDAKLITAEANVKQFGAKGNSVDDDTTAIGAAIDYAEAHVTPLYFPSGEYVISNEFTIDFAVTIKGDGDYLSKIKQTNTAKHIFIVAFSYCIVKDLCFESVDSSSVSMLQISAPSGHSFDNLISNCQFIGTNKTGYGLELYCPSTYGLMDNTVKDSVFRGLAKGIVFNVGSGWINGNKFDTLWFYTTVNGIEWLDTAAFATSSMNEFSNIKGQYSSGVNSLVYNVNGANNSFSDMHLWDGGITIQIGYHARYTHIKNFANFEIAKFIDYGFQTDVDNFITDRTRPYWTEYKDNFLVSRDDWADYTDSSTPATLDVVQTNSAVKIDTDATTNKYNAIEGNGYTLLGTGKQMLNFEFCLSSVEDIKIFLGLETSGKSQRQGNFLTLDTAADGLFHLKGITNINNSTFTGDLLLSDITPAANKWYKVQIWRNSDQRLDIWIDGEYIGGFNASQRYNQKPVFYIQTLANAAKTLAIREVKLRTYTY